METVQERLTKDLAKGKSIAWWAKGYYISGGGEHGLNLKIPFFDWEKNVDEMKPYQTTKILVDYLGSMMWIIVMVNWLHYGYGRTDSDSPSREAKEIRLRLEMIKGL